MAGKIMIAGVAAMGLAMTASAAILGGGGAAKKVAAASKAAPAKPATTPPVLGATLMWPSPTALTGSAQVTPASGLARPVLRPLLPLELSTMRLWNWNGTWIGSEWANGMSPLPWKFDHIKQPAGTDALLTLDSAGSAQLQGSASLNRSDGLWETEVTLPAKLREGVVVAPLWLYDPASRDEIDFELAGRRGLDVSLHVYVGGVHKQNTVRLFSGTDLSGKRMRFGIKLDQKSGFIDMYVDGKQVHRWDRATTGFFVSHPVKPWIELWAAHPSNAGFVSWVGKWAGLSKNESLTMRVHGYGYTTLSGKVER